MFRGLTRQDELCTKFKALGGSFSGPFSEGVTHLIASEVGSVKYRTAAKLDVPVLTPAWVNDSYENCTEMNSAEYRLKALAGFSICSTGFDNAERQAIESLCHKCGARYAPNLTRYTTHLLVKVAKGAKWDSLASSSFAHVWAVQLSWLERSFECGYAQDEQDYISPGFVLLKKERHETSEEISYQVVVKTESSSGRSVDDLSIRNRRVFLHAFTPQLESRALVIVRDRGGIISPQLDTSANCFVFIGDLGQYASLMCTRAI